MKKADREGRPVHKKTDEFVKSAGSEADVVVYY